MGGLTAVLSLALATHAVSVDRYPLREGCDPGEPVVAQLRRGDPVEIRFALAGEGGSCYKVSVQSGGKTLQGYVSADAISGVDEFEQGRRNAPSTNMPSTLKADTASLKKEILSSGLNDAGARAARLLESNRPNEALELLKPHIKPTGNDPGLLSLAGYAAYKADNMTLAIDYWKESLGLRPSPAVKRLLDVAEREAREDKSGEKLVGTRFLLRYKRGAMSRSTAREIVTTLEQEFSRISLELGCRLDERIVAIVQSPEEYRRTTDAAAWSGGQYNGRIRIAANDQTGIDERMRQTFAHEIVHACLARLGDYPAWLHEGLAQKLSGETLDPHRMQQVRLLARAGQLPRLDMLSQTWSRMSSLHAAVAYTTALAAIEMFYEHHSGLGARNLLRNPHLLPQVQADLDQRLRQ